MIIGKLLNPKLDYVFKRIFGSIGSEEITKDFLRAVTKENITDIELDCNPITEKDLYDDKISILDIKAKLNNNINCNIEMQIVYRKNIEKRILYYWSKMYTGSIKKGDDFEKLQKGIVVLISDYNLDNLKENNNYLTKWQIREEKTPKLILKDVLEIYIIELRKVSNDDQENNTLKAWLEFINNPEVKPKMGDKEELIKAREILEDMSRTKRERYLAEQREKWIMDKHAIHDAGYDKGKKEGVEEGIEKGRKYNIPNIRWHDLRATYATLLMKNKFSIKAISKRMGHAKLIITADVYGDKKEIIRDCTDNLSTFLNDVLPCNNNYNINDLTEKCININNFLNNTIDELIKKDIKIVNAINDTSNYIINEFLNELVL